MKKTLKITLILIVAGLYTAANLYAQQAGNLSDIAAQAAVVAAGNDAGSAAGGAFGPPDDEGAVGPGDSADGGEEGEGESGSEE